MLPLKIPRQNKTEDVLIFGLDTFGTSKTTNDR